MTVTLQLANAVRRLGRENLTVGEIAERLARPEAEITGALTMLGLPLPGETIEEQSSANEEELHAKLPKRWQDRIDKGKRGSR